MLNVLQHNAGMGNCFCLGNKWSHYSKKENQKVLLRRL